MVELATGRLGGCGGLAPSREGRGRRSEHEDSGMRFPVISTIELEFRHNFERHSPMFRYIEAPRGVRACRLQARLVE